MSHTTTPPFLAHTLWESDNTLLRNTVLAVAGTVVLWISAKLNIPFYPVPMTMQTFAVLTIGMAFGWRLGGATILLYLLEGALGLPVFAGTPERGVGLAYMVGPTGGYLVGFLVSAVVVGWLAERGWDRKFLSTLAAMTIGTAIIFALGAGWLGTILGWDKPIMEMGVTPFMLGAVFKIALAAAVLPSIWRYLSRV